MIEFTVFVPAIGCPMPQGEVPVMDANRPNVAPPIGVAFNFCRVSRKGFTMRVRLERYRNKEEFVLGYLRVWNNRHLPTRFPHAHDLEIAMIPMSRAECQQEGVTPKVVESLGSLVYSCRLPEITDVVEQSEPFQRFVKTGYPDEPSPVREGLE